MSRVIAYTGFESLQALIPDALTPVCCLSFPNTGLYKQLEALKGLLVEYREDAGDANGTQGSLRRTIIEMLQQVGLQVSGMPTQISLSLTLGLLAVDCN